MYPFLAISKQNVWCKNQNFQVTLFSYGDVLPATHKHKAGVTRWNAVCLKTKEAQLTNMQIASLLRRTPFLPTPYPTLYLFTPHPTAYPQPAARSPQPCIPYFTTQRPLVSYLTSPFNSSVSSQTYFN